MLLIVPPSETKRDSPRDGPPVDLGRLSFPELAERRNRVLDALVETSSQPDAFDVLRVGPSKLREVARNTAIRDLPAMPALDLYAGPLHQALDAAGLSKRGARRAEGDIVVVSPLWGALRPTDAIPTYRLLPYADLAGIGRVDHFWREVLPGVLAAAAGSGLAIDLRSPVLRSLGMPAGIANRTVMLRVDQGTPGNRIGDVIAKRVRGEAAHHLLESPERPEHPDALAAVLAERWPVRLAEPERPGATWTLTLAIER